MSAEINLLKNEQVYGTTAINSLRKNGLICKFTDFAILLGGKLGDNGNNAKWWLMDTDDNWEFSIPPHCQYVDEFGIITGASFTGSSYQMELGPHSRMLGGRPVINYAAVANDIIKSKVDNNGVERVEYGEYPQNIVNDIDAANLEKLYNKGMLSVTGKTYTTDSMKVDDYNIPFMPRKHIEYFYNGRRFVRLVGEYNNIGSILSDGKEIVDGKSYWVEVKPIEWIVDKKTNLMYTSDAIFSGVAFSNNKDIINFSKVEMHEFMNEYLVKDIKKTTVYDNEVMPMNIIDNGVGANVGINSIEAEFKQKLFDFDYKKVSEEDIIKGALESNVAVFLHGRSSEGKSARVKQYDPDCEIVYLRNATPDSLNGKSVYNSSTGEMIDIPPTWYKNLKEKCEAEPDKIHIVFFDEITNSLPSIQGMAYNIVLDKEVNGIWKLPENARVVAAGNEVKDSLAANKMAEPLFNRFAHVYIETSTLGWLEWAVAPEKKYEELPHEKYTVPTRIHPAIYSYIAYNAYMGLDLLRTPYNGETPNADPRKWEMASKVLYTTNNPHMLRSLVGKTVTNDFIDFCNKEIILTVSDVINGTYDNSIFDLDVSDKFLIVMGLVSVDEDNLVIVREFVSKLGEDYLEKFDYLWCLGNKERIKIIDDIKNKDEIEVLELY